MAGNALSAEAPGMRRRALPALAALAVGTGLLAQLSAAPYALWLANGSWTASALFAVLALAYACRRIEDPERRRPWAYLLAACSCWLAGQLAWDVLTATGVELPFPSLPDIGWLLFAPVALIGVYRLTPASVGAKAISALDAFAVAVVTGAVVGVFHYDNASHSELSDAGIAIALAYAVLHSAVAATIVQSLCTRLSLLRRPDLALLTAGLLTQGLAFTLWAGKLLDGSYRPGQEPIDVLWTLGMVAIGAGALRAVDGGPVAETAEHDIRLRGFLPGLATVVLSLVLVDFLITGAPLGERVVLRATVLVLLVVFSVRHWFVSAEHGRLVRSERGATERADRFFQLAPEMFSITGRGGGFVRLNARFAEVLGYSEEELLAQNALDLVHPDDRERTIEEMGTRLADGGLALAFENRFRRKDGTYAWMLWNARRDPVSGLVYAAAQDITDRKVGEEALLESERRFTELVTTIPEVFFIAHADLAGTIYVSPAYEAIWGRSCESLLDDPLSWVEAIHEDDRERVLEGVGRANVEGRVEHEFRIVRPDGEIRLVHELVTVVHDEDGRPARHVGIGSDVTEQRELEQQLQHARKLDAVGQLAGGVAHDFNNILTGIAGYTELALDRVEGLDDELRRDLQEVLRGARRASDLTRQLLTFARRDVVRPQVVDVNDVIEGLSRFLRGTIREDVLVVTELTPNLPRVKVDPHQLEQVLMNLVLNAGDAMPEGGVLTVCTRSPSPDEVTLVVSDTGIGLSEQTRSRMFEPFFTTKEVGKGTGLGLATVYGIVEECDGRIAVESTLGVGSRFAVTLPATHEPSETGCSAAEAPQPGGSERILLVEDDELVRRLTCEMLEREGYTVTAAASPEEALGLADAWDLLLTDVVMPVMNGPELAARFAAERGPLRVLFTSGYSGDTMVERGTLDPSVPLLEKPFSRHDLALMVRGVLDSAPAGYGTQASPPVSQPTSA
jgi:two-component system, cell cycle sensor histidine kinase and response regulator CckA